MIFNSIIGGGGQQLIKPTSAYQTCDYIETNGTSSYMTLPISISSYHDIQTKFEILTIKDSGFWGGRESASTNKEFMFLPTSNGGMAYQLGAGNTSASYPGSGAFSENTVYEIKCSSERFEREGVTYNMTSTISNFNANSPAFRLFNPQTGVASDSRWWHGRVYYFKVYDTHNNVLIFDGIPVYLIATPTTVGLWDRIRGALYRGVDCTYGNITP